MNYVYWLHNHDCLDIETQGYVGVTKDLDTRLSAHKRRNPRIPEDVQMKIIFEGSREDCFELEEKLRPEPRIGWNSAAGGKHGWKIGFSHSDETKEKLKSAWTNERKEIASKWKAQENKKLKGQKRPKQSKAISGKKNPMYGNTHSEEAKAKISAVHKGKTPHNKSELYCIHCHARASKSILEKYHGIGKKVCI